MSGAGCPGGAHAREGGRAGAPRSGVRAPHPAWVSRTVRPGYRQDTSGPSPPGGVREWGGVAGTRRESANFATRRCRTLG